MINVTLKIWEIFKRPDFLDFIKHKRTIFIKPNLCSDYLPPATTRLETIQAVIRNLRFSFPSLRLVLIESDQSTKTMEEKMHRLGWNSLLLFPQGVDECMNLTDTERLAVWWLDEHSGIINLPVIKTTDIPNVKFTAATKNLFGLIPDPRKAKYHKKIIQVLRSLKEYYRPSVYTIIDGKYCMDGPGSPLKGNTVEFPQFYIAGRNLDEVDTLVCQICGFDLASVRYLDPVTPTISKEDQKIFDEAVKSHFKFGNFAPSSFTVIRRVVFEVLPSDTDGMALTRIRKILGRGRRSLG